MGFAIPIDQARGLVEQILTYGKVVRPVLGITIAPPQLARQVGEEGVLVLEVPAGTPADKAGFKGTYRCACMLHACIHGGVAHFLKFCVDSVVGLCAQHNSPIRTQAASRQTHA